MAMPAERPLSDQFSVGKAVAAISRIVSATGESMYPVLKMLYLADKCHLERYGRFIVGDRYVAMEKGPVPSATYDMLKYVRGDRRFFDGGDLAKEIFDLDRQTHRFTFKAEPSLDALSESDVECLDEIIRLCKTRGAAHIRDASHDKAWQAAGRNDDMAIETIASQFSDGTALIQHLVNRHPL
jgi:Protein of unknown function (DUF4065)